MPLQKQNVSISFAQGLDTKTDPRQVVPGKLEALANSKFTTGMELTKRNGNSLLTSTGASQGNSVADFGDQLVSFDKYSLYSYNPGAATDVRMGAAQPIDVAAQFVTPARTDATDSIVNVYSARHSAGYIMYAYYTAEGVHQYCVVSEVTGLIIKTGSFGPGEATGFDHTRVNTVGNYFIISYNQPGTGLRYRSLLVDANIATNALATAVTIGTTSGSSLPYFQVVSANGVLNYVWNSPSGGNDRIAVRSLNSSLVLGTATFLTPASNGIIAIGAWTDTVLVAQQIWIAYQISSTTYYRVILASNYSTILGETGFTASSSTNKITGVVIQSGHSSMIYNGCHGSATAAYVTGDFIKRTYVDDSGTTGASSDIQRNISLVSDAFTLNSSLSYIYFVGAYGVSGGDNLQNTYFLFRHYMGTTPDTSVFAPAPIAKLAQGNCIPYVISADALFSANQIDTFQVIKLSETSIHFGIPRASQIQTNSGTITSLFSLYAYDINLGTNDAYQFQDLGNNLNFTGGYLYGYDSYIPSEQNFHLFPENFSFTSTTTGGLMAKAVYDYIVIFQITDNRGNIIRSAPSVAFSVDISGSSTDTNTVSLTFGSCNVTLKNNVTAATLGTVDNIVAVIYRNTPTGPGGNATDIFYKISQIPAIQSSSSLNYSGDTAADSSIIGNEILYTTGGVVENSGGPPCNAITAFKNRLFVCDAENRNTLWYSKQIITGTPVEMSASFTMSIDQRFGNITALAVMDDKLIIFKQNAIFYVTGNGPDNTGSNNDFSDATFVSSNAGCVDPRSIVVTQDGLMFKSNKGIYLLDRGLGVNYIGAQVEAYNSSHVTAARLIPQSTQVQFTLDDGATCLMYDYFYKQWSTFSNFNAAAATIYGNAFTYIDPTGHIYQEASGVYSDNGTAIYQSLTTSWLSLAGLQGFQRVYRLFFLYKYLSAHSVRVDVAYDFNDTVAQSVTLDATSQAVTNGSVGQWMINLDKQKCQSIKISITEIADSNSTIGAGLNIEAIGILVGSKLTYPKLPAAQEVTS